MDALKLNQRAKDQLHPLLSELMASYTRFKNSQEWLGRGKLLSWLIDLNKMRASDEIGPDQSRQVSSFHYSFIPFDQVEGGKTDKVRCCLMWRTLIPSRVLQRLGRVVLIFFFA